VNIYVVLGIGAALLLGAKQAAQVVAGGVPVEPAVPVGDITLIPATAFPTYTLPALPALPSAAVPSALPSSAFVPAGQAPVAIADALTPTTGGAFVPTFRPPVAAAAAGGSDFILSDKAMAKLGLAGIKQVTKWFLTPSNVQATPLTPDVASAWSSYRFGEYGDYTSWASQQSPITDVAQIDVASNVEALAVAENLTGGIDAGGVFAGEAGGLEAASSTVEATSMAGDTLSLLGPALQVLGVVAILVDVYFTVTGDQSTMMKAVNLVIDAALIVCLFIPVWGWIIALVLTLVKMVLNMFMKDGKAEKKMREAMETQWYAEHGAKPFMKGLVNVLSPREMVDYMTSWTSGYCGGVNEVAIAFTLINPDDPNEYVGIGSMHPGSNLPNECYWNSLGTYTSAKPYRGLNPYYMTRDDMALALVYHGLTDLRVIIQAGVAEEMKAPMNALMDDFVTKKLEIWRESMVENGLTLDELDMIASEQRKEPRLDAIAAYFGYPDWKMLVQWHLQDYWTRYIVTNREGSLWGFAAACGYDSWITMRDEIMESYGIWYDILTERESIIAAMEAWVETMGTMGLSAGGTPLSLTPFYTEYTGPTYA
jgi:hypothetical protein